MKNYLEINRKAYDVLAQEFDEKNNLRLNSFRNIVNEFQPYLNKFDNPKILELGPGSGYVSKLLSEIGYSVTAIEFSKSMAGIVRKVAPGVNLVVDEFLNHDFRDETFSGILAIAFIHLFQKTDVKKVMHKIHSLLVPNGVAFVSTTLHNKSEEGYTPKTNFLGEGIRYRRNFTKFELEDLFFESDFNILHNKTTVDNWEVNGKIWNSYVLEK